MSQFVNTNDLQQAIDEITNNSAAPKQPEVDATNVQDNNVGLLLPKLDCQTANPHYYLVH